MFYREPNALQIRVTFPEIEPPVWRQLVVPWTWHLGQLHLAIQAAFNWWNCHLRDFDRGEVAPFSYLYDFGDCWRHTVEIEHLLALDAAPRVGAAWFKPGLHVGPD
jgi:hypothetical protein